MAEEEIEYESDPEEAKLSLKSRRRVASDDEEEEEEEEREEGGRRREKPTRRVVNESDGESEGAPAEYEDEFGEEDGGYDLNEEYFEEEEEEEYEESGGERLGGNLEVVAVEGVVEGGDGTVGDAVQGMMKERKGGDNDAGEIDVGNDNVADGQDEEGRKEIEPFAVPTAGAFYMHDDRFRDNAGGRNRRMVGGRKLWESKDDKKWGHDKFEELTMQERHHEEHRRGSRGRFRGHGRNRGAARGYSQRNRPREYSDYGGTQQQQHHHRNNNNNNNNNNNQNNASKGIRGHGPRRYQPLSNNEVPVKQNKQSGKFVEKHLNASSVRINHPVSNAESDVVQPRKQVASNLNIASPPFYPTGSSTKDSNVPLKRDAQASSPINRNGVQSMVDVTSNAVQSSGKNTVDSIGLDKLKIDDSVSAMTGKPSNTMLMPLSVSSSIGPTQPQLRGQDRAPNVLGQMTYQPAVSSNQFNRIPSRSQSSGQAYVQQFAQCMPSGLQAYSPPKAAGAVTALKSGEMESTSLSSQMKTASADKGKGGAQTSGKGSFLYGGPQIMGASSSPGDQNFPTFLPVMQFGGQHPGGIGVPAVGMAFPGYVGQPQLGLGSSEMTWLPVLTGAAGALGSYCPPYLPVDGSYNTRPSGAASSTTSTSSKDTSTVKAGNEWKPVQKPELASHEFGQKQKNPRRYTEMKFDH